MGRTTQVPCDTEFPAFISERTIKENTGNVDCDGCIKYETPAQIRTRTNTGPTGQIAVLLRAGFEKREAICENSVKLLNFILEKSLSAYPSTSLMTRSVFKSFVVR